MTTGVQREAGVLPTGEVALVTGASGALGGAVARLLDSLGIAVALHYHRNQEAAEKLASTLHNPTLTAAADLADWPSVRDLEERVRDRLGPVTVLVNSAAVRHDGLLATQTIADWHRSIEVNLLGTFHTCRAVTPYMLSRRRGRIINVVSPAATVGSPGQTAYSASKAGVMGLTRSLAVECARRNVTVNALSPGFMDSDITREVPEERRTGFIGRVPLRRPTTPDEVARAVRYLIDTGYMTGQMLAVDGGLSIS